MTSNCSAHDAADFGRTYWRSAPSAAGSLAPLTSALIDDATFRLLAAPASPSRCWSEHRSEVRCGWVSTGTGTHSATCSPR